jgi:hypothetical protein
VTAESFNAGSSIRAAGLQLEREGGRRDGPIVDVLEGDVGGADHGEQLSVFFFDSGTHIGDKPPMPKKPGTNPKGEFAFFNVVYEDGSQRSNRRVPAELLGGLDGDKPAHGFILEQDREIAARSGRPPLTIKSVSRVGAKKK